MKAKSEPKIEPIPENLNAEPFLSLWATFQQHRTELKKTMTPISMRLALKKLSDTGIQSACDALTTSIENGWQGVFPRHVTALASLPESHAALWDRWRNARRAASRTDPAKAPGDLRALEAMACECRTGAEFWHVFKAYCEDEDGFLQSRGWALEWLPQRMNKYTDALLTCRSMQKRKEVLNASATIETNSDSPTAFDKHLEDLTRNGIPY